MKNKLLKISFILSLLLISISLPLKANSDIYIEDTYGFLNDSEKQSLTDLATQVSDKYQYGVYVHFIYDEDSYDDIDSYIEQYYSNQQLGYGDSSNGILLLITQSSRGGTYQTYIPYNSNQEYFSLSTLDYIEGNYVNYLYQHDYYNTAFQFINDVDEVMQYYIDNGSPYVINYEYNDGPKEEYYDYTHDIYYQEQLQRQENLKLYKTIAVFGLPPVTALIVVLIMISKNKTKRKALQANQYIRDDGFSLSNYGDIFLYHTVTRRKINTDNNHGGRGGFSSGGSHHSSSGGMHSRGGHF